MRSDSYNLIQELDVLYKKEVSPGAQSTEVVYARFSPVPVIQLHEQISWPALVPLSNHLACVRFHMTSPPQLAYLKHNHTFCMNVSDRQKKSIYFSLKYEKLHHNKTNIM